MALVKLYTGRDAMDAHFVRAHLEGQGIPATVMGEALTMARGDLPLTPETLPAVWVHEEDAPRAVAAMREFLRTPRHDEPEVEAKAWTCPHCGELIEGQFDQCWNCGWERPE